MIAALVLLSACGSGGQTTTEPSNAAPAESSTNGSAGSEGTDDAPSAAGEDSGTSDDATTPAAGASLGETRDEILRLARTQLDGVDFDPETVAGRDVLLWFWAPW